MKLLIVINVDWFFLSHRLDIARAAVAAGWEVHVATALTSDAGRLSQYGFHIHALRIERSSAGPLTNMALILRLIRLYRVVDPDVVHLVTIKPALLGGIAARIARTPAVVYAISGLGHVFSSSDRLAGLQRALVRRLYRFAMGVRAKRVIFQNEHDLAELQAAGAVSKSKSVLIPGSGVDVDGYVVEPLRPGATVFLMASRLLTSKGVREFCEAASVLRDSGADVECWLAGAPDFGNPQSITNSMLDTIRDTGAVRLLGHRNDIPELISSAHVVVLPSYYGEGLPKVLIEAAAAGRAVITTDMPGCRDAVESQVTGVLVAPRDVTGLAQSMRLLAEDRSLVKAMGDAGRRRAEELFRIEDVISRHLGIYSDLFAESRSGQSDFTGATW